MAAGCIFVTLAIVTTRMRMRELCAYAEKEREGEIEREREQPPMVPLCTCAVVIDPTLICAGGVCARGYRDVADKADPHNGAAKPGQTTLLHVHVVLMWPVQVVYVREGIAMWPTKQVRIMGRLSLVKQHCVMFLSWLPYSAGSLNADGTFQLPAGAARGTSAPPPEPHGACCTSFCAQ